jgi:hypothetical protein
MHLLITAENRVLLKVLMGPAVNSQVLQKAWNFLESLATISFTKSSLILRGVPWLLLLMTIMSMRWYYVSELRQPAGLLFVSQVIYEHIQPLWNDVDRGNSWFVHQSSGNSTSSHLVSGRRNGRREWWICLCEVFLFIPPKWFYMS